jgi:hypothetical protein
MTAANFVELEGLGVVTLVRNIDSKDENIRIAVITVLGMIGPPAKSALARLKAISQEDADQAIREAAGAAVKKIER